MESNNYEWFITDTVEAMLPIFSDPKLVLVMCVDMSWNDFGYDEDGNTKIREERKFSKKHWLIFHRPNNYTKVLGTDEDLNPFDLLSKKPIKFKQYCDHDSCWRSDGMNWMFQTFVEAWSYFDQFGIEGRKIDPMVHWHVFQGKPSYWLVESIKPVDEDERWTTDYMIKFDKKIPITEAVKYMPEEKEDK